MSCREHQDGGEGQAGKEIDNDKRKPRVTFTRRGRKPVVNWKRLPWRQGTGGFEEMKAKLEKELIKNEAVVMFKRKLGKDMDSMLVNIEEGQDYLMRLRKAQRRMEAEHDTLRAEISSLKTDAMNYETSVLMEQAKFQELAENFAVLAGHIASIREINPDLFSHFRHVQEVLKQDREFDYSLIPQNFTLALDTMHSLPVTLCRSLSCPEVGLLYSPDSPPWCDDRVRASVTRCRSSIDLARSRLTPVPMSSEMAALTAGAVTKDCCNSVGDWIVGDV